MIVRTIKQGVDMIFYQRCQDIDFVEACRTSFLMWAIGFVWLVLGWVVIGLTGNLLGPNPHPVLYESLKFIFQMWPAFGEVLTFLPLLILAKLLIAQLPAARAEGE